MKKIIKIKTQTKQYNIIIEKKSIVSSIVEEKKNNKKIFILIDTKVFYLISKLKVDKNIYIIKINGGEKIKSNHYYSKICSKLLKLNINRSSTIIAIGGGTIGDLSGFVASTILRGVKFILMPTTLLSQVDSSIGGKNGINTESGKNLIGTFFQPDKVIIDPLTLKTLSKRELKSGYAEILKHALIKDIKFYNWLNKNCIDLLNLKYNYISLAIINSIKIKKFFVEKDEKEKLINSSSRAMLNFGHTFGHALETIDKFSKKLTHGEAIAIGMAVAIKISYNMKQLTKNEYNNFIKHLVKVNLPYFNKKINTDKIYKIIVSDKKNSDNLINLVLLKKIGSAYFKRDLKIEEVKKLIN